MSSNGHNHEPSAIEGDDTLLPTSHLQRPSADAIIADEADDNALLGNESDSEPSTSRRNSTAQPSERRISKRKSQILAAAGDKTTNSTEKRKSVKATKAVPNEADLQAQIADLTNQVTGLNTKLVSSFMRVSDLEDDLSDKQEQLTWHQTKVATLEKEREQHLAALNTGLLVEKAHVTSEMQKMMERVMEETAERGKAISDKEKIESELDDLSSNLFSEANKMVAVERLARAIAEEKSKSMEERLRNTEEIMEQQQKRLAELQSVVEKGDKERSAEESGTSKAVGDGPKSGEDSAGPATSILAIEEKQLRLDIIPYTELRAFLNHLRKLRLQLAPFYTYPLTNMARNASGSGQPSPNGSRANSPAPYQVRVSSPGQPSGSSTLQAGNSMLSPFSAAGVSRHRDFPNLPSNVEQLINLPSQISSVNLLKRINEEDCEPCLRLDMAPGLNWLTRRQLQTSILEGNLLIEPVFGGGIYDEAEVRNRALGSPPAACAMCGKLVVNVPLPGGGNVGEGGSWMSAAGNAANTLQASVGNSFPGREQSSSPPLSSGSFFGGTNSTNQSIDSLQKKKSSTGLFNTLRSIGSGSPKPSLPSNLSGPRMSATSSADESHSIVEEDLFSHRLAPIPTHIFRIGETSSSRYLLCPDYCLHRLRVICEFWSYIRNLERAVVLEGKLAWDEEQSSHTPVQPEKKEAGNIKEITTELDDTSEQATPSVTPLALDADKEEKNAEESEAEDEEDHEDAPSIHRESERTVSTHGSNTDDEDGFADAQSIHSATDSDHHEVDEDKDEEGIVAEATVVVVEAEEPLTPTKEKEAASIEEVIAPSTQPPLPPRAKARRPVPVPPPALPPRRPSNNGNIVANTPEPRRLLSAKGESHLTWEEKVWLEITRLRADMWSARVGVQKQN
jgi:hypothetical protein